jgi:hypothetical protein
MLQHNDSRNPRDQESTECSTPPIPQKAEDWWDAEADQDGDPLDVSILPANELVFLQVGDVIVRLIGLQLAQQKQIEALTAGLQKVSAQVEMTRPAPQMAENNQ